MVQVPVTTGGSAVLVAAGGVVRWSGNEQS